MTVAKPGVCVEGAGDGGDFPGDGGELELLDLASRDLCLTGKLIPSLEMGPTKEEAF